MASNDDAPAPVTPKRRSLRLIILIVLVILALCDAALLLYLHHKGAPKRASETSAAQTTAISKETASSAALPGFDVVRVDPQGNTVIAGRATPGAKVIIKDGNAVLGTVVADAQGEFVFLPKTPLASGTHEITLSETLPSGKTVDSVESASIDVPGNGKTALAVVSGPDGSRVLTGQGPIPGQLGMGTVDYDAHGHAIFSGTAPSGSTVTLALGGQVLGKAVADAAGRWHLEASTPDAPGMITLNASDAKGQLLSSVKVPFAPEKLATALTEGRVLIEPGDNLWIIARKVYGHGIMYTLIYSANAAQIHNPNLIFPGQNFVLPAK